MSFEPFVAVAIALLLFTMLWLPGGREVRRVASIVAIIALAGATTFVLLARPGADPEGGTSGASLPGGSSSPAPSGATPPAGSAGSAEPSGSPTVLRHEVGLEPGGYSIFTVAPDGTVTGELAIGFDEPSRAPVDRIEAPNGLIHWRTVGGGYTGWSYIAGRSGPFSVREVLRWPDGETGYREVDPGS